MECADCGDEFAGPTVTCPTCGRDVCLDCFGFSCDGVYECASCVVRETGPELPSILEEQ